QFRVGLQRVIPTASCRSWRYLAGRASPAEAAARGSPAVSGPTSARASRRWRRASAPAWCAGSATAPRARRERDSVHVPEVVLVGPPRRLLARRRRPVLLADHRAELLQVAGLLLPVGLGPEVDEGAREDGVVEAARDPRRVVDHPEAAEG